MPSVAPKGIAGQGQAGLQAGRDSTAAACSGSFAKSRMWPLYPMNTGRVTTGTLALRRPWYKVKRKEQSPGAKGPWGRPFPSLGSASLLAKHPLRAGDWDTR